MVLVLTDNLYLYDQFQKIVKSKSFKGVTFDYYYSYNNKLFAKKFQKNQRFTSLNINKEVARLIKKYDLMISLHCKQIFPKKLLEKVKCVNVHPGLIPYNRGWFPQVFSIINGLPFGATIHEMDDQIDHGPIIAQKKVRLYPYDTSLSAYERVLQTELKLINKNIEQIINNQYNANEASLKGNINYQKDFERLRHIDLEDIGTFKIFINKLRALSHGDYKNAYFIDPETKQKIYLRLELEPDD